MSNFNTEIRRLAAACVSGRWDRATLAERLSRSLGGGPPDPQRLAARLVVAFGHDTPPRQLTVQRFLHDEPLIKSAWHTQDRALVQHLTLEPHVTAAPPKQLVVLPLPDLPSWESLCRWLGLLDHELAWFAACHSPQHQHHVSKFHHYRYRWNTKRYGLRLLEIPKERLKTLQRVILREILNRVPAHDCAHGFVRGRSCLSHATPHVAKSTVLTMDLLDFFHSIPSPRITALFRCLGYPHNVASLLCSLCTHSTSPYLAGPEYAQLSWRKRKRLQARHLPQGAPTSPALANLCAWRFDCRVAGLARRFDLDYTRYADDLAFSGSPRFKSVAPRFEALIAAIASEEGFHVNHRKTRLRTQAQRQSVTGLVVNAKPNISRRDYDNLKATLYNCVKHRPATQNHHGSDHFKTQLAGRLAHIVHINPDKGRRLQALWDEIEWES